MHKDSPNDSGHPARRHVSHSFRMYLYHHVEAGLNGRLLNVFNDPLFTDQNQLGIEKSIFERMFAPPIIYFAIAGAAQIAFNIFYLVILW